MMSKMEVNIEMDTEIYNKVFDYWVNKTRYNMDDAITNLIVFALSELSDRNIAYLSLTPAERDVYYQICAEKSVPRIAKDMERDIETIKCHLYHIRKKFGVKKTIDIPKYISGGLK